MFVKVKTYDGEEILVNPQGIAIMKWHPSEKKPECGVLILPSGKEYFLTRESFRNLLENANNETSIKTNKADA